MKTILKALKKGDILSEESHYIVRGTIDGGVNLTHFESG